VSARSDASLRGLATALRDWARANPEAALGDVAYTLLAGRGHFEKRLALVAGDLDDLCDGLDAWLGRNERLGVDTNPQAKAYLDGGLPDIETVFAGDTPRRIALPVTPFDRAAYWVDDAPLPRAAPRFTCAVDPSKPASVRVTVPSTSPLLRDHTVGGQSILPGFSLPEILRAALVVLGDAAKPFGLADLTFLRPITAQMAGSFVSAG
jgi:acyl transferase domain-containing protein